MSLNLLSLVLRDDFTSDIDTLSLLSYTDGFNLAMQGWTPEIMPDDQKTVAEAITLRVQADDDDDLAAIKQALREKRTQAGYYFSGVDKYGVWLRAQLADETYARQALLKTLNYKWGQSIIRPNRAGLENFILGAERFTWEDTAYTEFTGSSVGAIGGTFAFSSNAGDLPARLAYTKLEDNGGAGEGIYKYWLGFRGTRYSSTPANFAPVWDLHDASFFGDDTTGGTSNADATANDSFKVVCTFATEESMVYRVCMRVRDAAAYSDDQRGRFKLLLRAKLSAGSTVVRVRRHTGPSISQQTWAVGPRVAVSGTTWQYYDLGNISIPGIRPLANRGTPGEFQIGVQAERESGAASLELDCLILIPLDEGFIHMGRVDSTAYTTPDFEGFQFADGRIEGVIHGATYVAELVPTVIEGGLPVGSGIGVLAAERYQDSDKADTADVRLRVYQRWESLRGDDT